MMKGLKNEILAKEHLFAGTSSKWHHCGGDQGFSKNIFQSNSPQEQLKKQLLFLNLKSHKYD